MAPNKALFSLGGIILLAGSIYLGVLTWNAIKAHDYIGVPDSERHSVTISGEGKVTAVPDIAKISLGYSVEKRTVAAAQKDNTDKMNAMIDDLKKTFGIDAKDIETTSYNISPMYDWSDGRQTLRGYQVSQNIGVKVRKMDQAGDILSKAGELGLNQIGSLAFTFDDPEKVKSQAREKALLAAKEKAGTLAQIAGVKLGKIISFSEASTDGGIRPVYDLMGRGGAEEKSIAAPQVEAGSTEVIVNVSVEYEIL